jgi:hypothetical protein
MMLLSMTIPDDPAELAAWLEQRLTAPDFGRFVAELTALHPDTPRESLPARQLLGAHLREALDAGLRRVPVDVLRQLLRRPDTLTELQELLLTEGGRYWDDVLQRAEGWQPLVESGRHSLGGLLGPDPEVVKFTKQNARPPADPVTLPFRKPEKGYRRLALFGAALAACVAVVVTVLVLNRGQAPVDPPPSVAWGWAKPGGIPSGEQKPQEYLTRLASSGEEWFEKRPDDVAGLKQRLTEMLQGCGMLIAAKHQPLAKADQDWLVERCRVWAGKFDEQLAALAGGADVLQVREQADVTVRNLARALRARAQSVG